MDHPRASAFERFIIGALTDVESASFVTHVSDCDACAKKLEAEAQLELAIVEVHAASNASRPVRRAPPARRWRLIGVGAGSLALAAALFVVLGRRHEAHDAARVQTATVSARRAVEPIPLTVCPDDLEQEKCVEEAHRHGLFVSYPPWASGPPLGGGRAGQGPSSSPFTPQQM